MILNSHQSILSISFASERILDEYVRQIYLVHFALPEIYVFAAAVSPAGVCKSAPAEAKNTADAVNASSMPQGFGGLCPVSSETLASKRSHVVGKNCAGPMAPPHP